MHFAEESMRIRLRSSSLERLRESVSRKLVGSRVRNSTENSNSNSVARSDCEFIFVQLNRQAEFCSNLNKDYLKSGKLSVKSRVFPIDFESRNSLEPRGSLYIPTQRWICVRYPPFCFPPCF